MATTIKLKNSVTSSAAPSSLTQGEAAVNVTDKKLWVGNAASSPVQLIGTGASVNFTTITTANDATIAGLTVGKGGSSTGTNSAVGISALAANTNGYGNAAFGYNSLLSNTDGYSNSGLGRDALRTNTTGSNNTAVGRDALYSNTTASNNTAVGFQAGYSGTTATGNVCLGYKALYNGTDVAYNTAIGFQALDALSAGADFNVAVGASSLGSTTSGENNTAVGTDSLASNTTASNNTAVGYVALQANTTGSENTSVGQGAGYSNTTGSSNTAVGFQPLAANTTGNSNVAIGRNALASNTTASNNTAVGYQAGISNTTTGGNTYIGLQAGYSTTANNNTFVGTAAGFQVTTGGQNTIIGRFQGNSGGLDIRTASNYIVLSDGDGNPRGYWNNVGTFFQKYAYPNTGAVWQSDTASSHYAITFNNSNGQVGSITTAASATAYNTSSDYRLKDNIAPMVGALDRVSKLKPVTYNWKIDGSSGEGFIAHELQQVVAGCVTGEKDAVDFEGKPVYQGIDTSFLVATLVAAIQELKAEIDTLKGVK